MSTKWFLNYFTKISQKLHKFYFMSYWWKKIYFRLIERKDLRKLIHANFSTPEVRRAFIKLNCLTLLSTGSSTALKVKWLLYIKILQMKIIDMRFVWVEAIKLPLWFLKSKTPECSTNEILKLSVVKRLPSLLALGFVESEAKSF